MRACYCVRARTILILVFPGSFRSNRGGGKRATSHLLLLFLSALYHVRARDVSLLSGQKLSSCTMSILLLSIVFSSFSLSPCSVPLFLVRAHVRMCVCVHVFTSHDCHRCRALNFSSSSSSSPPHGARDPALVRERVRPKRHSCVRLKIASFLERRH